MYKCGTCGSTDVEIYGHATGVWDEKLGKLAVDATHVYWVNTQTTGLNRVPKIGGTMSRVGLDDSPVYTGGVAVDGTHVYWVIWQGVYNVGLRRVLTTGGTGLTPRDITPEATRTVLEKEAPGIAEALRMAVYPRFHRAALSRGTAGVRGRTLVVNLPGSPGGVRDGLAVLDDLVAHAVGLVRGTVTDHAAPDPERRP